MMMFYPGDEVAFLLAKFLLALCLTCGVGCFLSLAFRQNYSARHSILLSTLIACLLLPGVAVLFWAMDVSLLSLPWLPAEAPFADRDFAEDSSDRVTESSSSPSVANVPRKEQSIHRPGTALGSTSEKISSPPSRVETPRANVPPRMALENPSPWRQAAALGILLWAIGSVLLLVRVAWSSLRLARLARAATALPLDRLGPFARRFEKVFGHEPFPQIRVSDDVPGPLAFGIFRKRILLPSRMWAELSDDQLGDVLVHEAAHLVRNDPLVLLLERIAGSLYWPIPLIYSINRQLDQVREELCDNHVLLHRDAIHYGGTLLRVAELVCFAPPVRGANTMLTRPGRLESRIKNLLDVRRNTMTTRSRGWTFFGFSLLLAAGGLACGVQIVSAQGEASRPIEGTPVAQTAFVGQNDTASDGQASQVEKTNAGEKTARRLVFKPKHGMENESSWTALADFPLEDKTPYEHMQARLTLLGEVPVQRKGDKTPIFKIKLVAGSDDSLNVRLTGADKMPYDRILHRDKPLAWKIKGETYRIVYPTTEGAGDEPAESHFAFVFVSCRPVKQGDANANDPQESLPPEKSTDNSQGDGGSDLLRNIRTATAPILKDLAENAGYGLRDGEVVRHVPLPYSDLRTTYYRVGHPHQSDVIPKPPTHMLFHWTKDGLRNWGMSFGGPPESGQSIGDIVSSVTDFESQEIEGDKELLEKRIAGDWVVRTGEKPEKLLPPLEAILRKELSLPIHLEIKTVEREVFVASGQYKLTPLAGQKAQGQLHLTDKTITTDEVHIFGKSFVPDSGAGGGTGDFDEFLKSLGHWIDVPIVKEVEQGPVREISWSYHQRSPFTDQMQKEDKDTDTVLGNIAKQTGIKFTRQMRPVKILFVTREG